MALPCTAKENSNRDLRVRTLDAKNPQADALVDQWYRRHPRTVAASDLLFKATGKRVPPVAAR